MMRQPNQITITNGRTLADVITDHRRWLRGEPGGSGADLHDAVLRGADLRGADLRGADLHGADLRADRYQPAPLPRSSTTPAVALHRPRLSAREPVHSRRAWRRSDPEVPRVAERQGEQRRCERAAGAGFDHGEAPPRVLMRAAPVPWERGSSSVA